MQAACKKSKKHCNIPKWCIGCHELIFFPPVFHFFATLGCIFPNPTHIFPTLDFAWARRLKLEVKKMHDLAVIGWPENPGPQTANVTKKAVPSLKTLNKRFMIASSSDPRLVMDLQFLSCDSERED